MLIQSNPRVTFCSKAVIPLNIPFNSFNCLNKSLSKATFLNSAHHIFQKDIFYNQDCFSFSLSSKH